MFSLNGTDIAVAKKQGVLQAQELAAKKVIDLERLITTTQEKNRILEDKKQSTDTEIKGDWTEAYSYWSQWEDVEELNVQLTTEEENYTKLMGRPDFMGHFHDHTEERNIFYLPEQEKLEYCEKHHRRGNALFHEELFPKAAEQYQIALSYYEYCFPQVQEDQEYLDTIRCICLSNISLCYLRMGFYRKAEEAASQLIRDDNTNSKAYFRRAQAHRAQDNFEEAIADIRTAAELNPADNLIKAEWALLNTQQQLYLQRAASIARRTFSSSDKPIQSEESCDKIGNEGVLDVLAQEGRCSEESVMGTYMEPTRTGEGQNNDIPTRWDLLLDADAMLEPVADAYIDILGLR